MMTEWAIRKRIKELESDSRLHYTKAIVETNAGLALIQVRLKAELDGLYYALGEDRPTYKCG